MTTSDKPDDPRLFPRDLYGWPLKLFGLLITGLAISQGPPRSGSICSTASWWCGRRSSRTRRATSSRRRNAHRASRRRSRHLPDPRIIRADFRRAMHRRHFLHAVAGTAAAPLLIPRALSGVERGWRAGAAAIDITPRGRCGWPGLPRARGPRRAWRCRCTRRRWRSRTRVARRRGPGDARSARRHRRDVGATSPRGGRRARAATRSPAPRTPATPTAGRSSTSMLSVAYDLTAAQRATIRDYTDGAAVTARRSDWRGDAGAGAGDAARRRVGRDVRRQPPRHVPRRASRRSPRADPARRRRRRRPRAIVFGYACHNTTLRDDEVEFHGDYAGVAQAALEARHPGAQRDVRAGLRRRRQPDAARHARAGHAARRRTGRRRSKPACPRSRRSDGRCRRRSRRVDLPFAPLPDRAEWRRRSQAEDVYVRRHARADARRSWRARAACPPRRPSRCRSGDSAATSRSWRSAAKWWSTTRCGCRASTRRAALGGRLQQRRVRLRAVAPRAARRRLRGRRRDDLLRSSRARSTRRVEDRIVAAVRRLLRRTS